MGRRSQRGFLLIVAVILIAVAATMAAVIVTLTAGSSGAGGLHLTSAQALYAAESGLDQVVNQSRNGTDCAGLANATPTTVGLASYTLATERFNPTGVERTTLTAVLNAGDTTMSVADTSNYAPRGGRLRVNGEDILYAGTTATSFTGLQRGYAATTVPATHAVGSVVNQDVCVVTSTGTSEQAMRRLELGILPGPWSSFVDGGSANIGDGPAYTTLASLPTALPAGDNIVIAAVTLNNVTNADTRTTIEGLVSTGGCGDLRLVRNGTICRDWNEYDIRIGGVDNGGINTNGRPQKTFFLLARDTGRPSGDTYTVEVLASNNNTIAGEVKMFIINNPPATSANFTASSFNTINATESDIVTLNTGFGAGTNLIVAWVQLDNREGNAERTIPAGALRLRRTAASISANEYAMTLRRSGGGDPNPNRGATVLLLGLDTNAPANATYTISGRTQAGGNVRAFSYMVAIHGLGAAFVDGASTGIDGGATLATLATSFPALYPGRSNLVIVSTQYDNARANATRDVNASSETISFNGTGRVSNEYLYRMCRNGTSTCRHFSHAGLLWRHTAQTANPATNPNLNPSYSVTATGSAAGIDGEAKILGIHLDPLTERREIFP